MQLIVTIVQNAVDKKHMGSATSSVAFFRSMGGTFGAAVFGAILSSRLTVHLADQFGGRGGAPLPAAGGDVTGNVQKIQQLPEPVHGLVLNAFADSLHDVFLWAIPVVVIALAVSFFIKEVPLKMRNEPAAGRGRRGLARPLSAAAGQVGSLVGLVETGGFDKLNRRVAPRAG